MTPDSSSFPQGVFSQDGTRRPREGVSALLLLAGTCPSGSQEGPLPPTFPAPRVAGQPPGPMTQGFLQPILPEGPKVKAQAKSVSQSTLCPRLSSPGASQVGTREPAPLERGLRDSLGQPSLNLFTEAGLPAAWGLRQALSSCCHHPVPDLCLAGSPGVGCGHPWPCHRSVASLEPPGRSTAGPSAPPLAPCPLWHMAFARGGEPPSCPALPSWAALVVRG